MLDSLSDLLTYRPGVDRLLLEAKIISQFFDLKNQLIVADHHLVIWCFLLTRRHSSERDSIG